MNIIINIGKPIDDLRKTFQLRILKIYRLIFERTI